MAVSAWGEGGIHLARESLIHQQLFLYESRSFYTGEQLRYLQNLYIGRPEVLGGRQRPWLGTQITNLRVCPIPRRSLQLYPRLV